MHPTQVHRAKELPRTVAYTPERPQCTGVYVPPHPVAGKRCVSSSQYTIDGKPLCTTHARTRALSVLLEEWFNE
jgi:hypothetical protein